MADDRDSYKNQDITLELHEDDISGGVPSAPERVIIFQDKEVCYGGTQWDEDIDYILGTLVFDGGVDYKCILAHTSSLGNEPPNPTYWAPAITEISPGVWSISLNTDQIKYTGDYIDRWVLSGSGDDPVEKSLTVSEAVSNDPKVSTLNPVHFSKDLYWDVQSNGDIYRIYDNNSIAAKIEAVVMTVRGSLFNEPGHGTDLYRYLFSMSPSVSNEIRLELETQIQMQVPQIKVSSINVEAVDHNTYNVTVNFLTISSSNPNELLSMTNLVSIEGVVG